MLYSKNGEYPVDKIPFRIRDGKGKTYTNENAYLNRHKVGYIDVDDPPVYNADTHSLEWDGKTIKWKLKRLTKKEKEDRAKKEIEILRQEREAEEEKQTIAQKMAMDETLSINKKTPKK